MHMDPTVEIVLVAAIKIYFKQRPDKITELAEQVVAVTDKFSAIPGSSIYQEQIKNAIAQAIIEWGKEL